MTRSQGSIVLIVILISISLAYTPMIKGDSFFPQREMGCENCHSSFVPFQISAIPPKNYVPGTSAQFEVKVVNSQNHKVKNITAHLKSSSLNKTTQMGNLTAHSRTEVKWNLTLSKEDADMLKVEVIGTAEYMHYYKGHDDSEYTVKASFDTSIVQDRDIKTLPVLEGIIWQVRYTIAVMFFTVMVLGVPQTRWVLTKLFNIKAIRWSHKGIAFSMIPMFCLHAYIELMIFPLQSLQAIMGIALAILIATLDLTGYRRPQIKRFYSRRAWRRIHGSHSISRKIHRKYMLRINKWRKHHRLLSIVTIVVLILHVFLGILQI